MSVLTENSFERLADPVVSIAERFTLQSLERITRIARRVVNDPDVNINTEAELQAIIQLHEQFLGEADEWSQEAIAGAYIRGIEDVNGTIDELGADVETQDVIFEPETAVFASVAAGFGGGDIPPAVAERFANYRRHLTMYEVFRASAFQDFSNTRFPVVRDVRDKIRELAIQASDMTYRSGDDFTRRQLTQDLMNEFADNNITGIRYSDGRTMKLDTYSEMVARTQTGNAARQAQLNRLQEYDIDLVQVSVHWPTSDLCAPHQGRVFSQSGRSTQYPPFSDTNPGGELFHSNCKHSVSAYIPGTSPGRKEERNQLSKKENERRYQLTQKQRYNERQIRHWKRRQATAITEDAQSKAKAKIRQWQKKNRELVDSNDFLRRKYFRESV